MPLRQKLGLGFVMLWFFGGSIGHFVPPGTAFFVSIVPLWLPNPKALVYISGVLEIISATGLFFAVTRRWAGYALILIVIGVTPANVHMWLHPELFPQAPQWMYAFRLVFQVFLLWLIWWSTRPPQAWQRGGKSHD